jgi:hypothetical protein
MMIQRITGLYLFLLGTTAAATPEIDALVQWINEHTNAVLHEALEVRQVEGEDDNYGIFATQDIPSESVLTKIPWQMVIATDEEDDEDESEGIIECGTVRNLKKEFELGTESNYAPYILYLLSLKERKLPSAWSEVGKAFLEDLLGYHNPNPHSLPPKAVSQMLQSDWLDACGGDPTDDLSLRAAELYMRKYDQEDLMIPLFDLIEHRNGEYTNVNIETKYGKYHKTLASRDILAGEQLYRTIDLCTGCSQEAIDDGYGTSGKLFIYVYSLF